MPSSNRAGFGQQRNVQVVKFAMRATVEERVLAMNRVAASADTDGARAASDTQATQKQFTAEQVLRLLGSEVAAGPNVVELE
jgi:SNF2 family DNA or RNA helicase